MVGQLLAAGSPQDAALQRALAALRTGRIIDAENLLKEALRADQRNVAALNLLGILLMQLGRFADAESYLGRALQEQPKSDPTLYNYGIALKALNRPAEALERFSQAATINGAVAETWNNRGTVYNDLKRYHEAIADFERAIGLDPRYAEAFCNKANSYAALEQFDHALSACQRALELNPDLAEAWCGCGDAYWQLKRYEEASAAFDRALALKPGFAEAWVGRGKASAMLKRYDEAFAAFDKALALKADLAEAWLGRANVSTELKRHDEAFAAYEKALALKPDLADTWLGRGNVFADLKRYDEAFAAYDKALALKPDLADAHFNKALLRLKLGELIEGWKEYEYRSQTRLAIGRKRNLQQPLWLGDSDIRNKTILVHAEQGFGDTLLGCRYIPMVAQLGARVVAEVQAPLKSLLQNLEGISTLISQGDVIPSFDVHCPIMSLPLAFKTTIQTIPARTPYLTVSEELFEKWRSKLIGEEIKVGIGWAGNANFHGDGYRSILLNNLLPALGIKGVRYFSIQKTLRQGDERLLDANPQIVRLDQKINDFQDTAAIMMSLDLVLSSDTSIVNLAGALGRPFWVLLQDTPDWRWLAEGTSTPWYPTGRLFRQRAIGDWTAVTDEVRAELERLVARR